MASKAATPLGVTSPRAGVRESEAEEVVNVRRAFEGVVARELEALAMRRVSIVKGSVCICSL